MHSQGPGCSNRLAKISERGREGGIEKRGRASGKPASKAKQEAHASSQADPALVVGIALPAVSCSGRCQKVFDLRGEGSVRGRSGVLEEHEKRKMRRERGIRCCERGKRREWCTQSGKGAASTLWLGGDICRRRGPRWLGQSPSPFLLSEKDVM